MSEIEEIYNILIGQGYSEKLFSELSGQKKEGSDMRATCPFCGHHTFTYSLQDPLWHCKHPSCDEGGDWASYLMEYEGMEFQEALQYLGDEAGVDVDVSGQARKTFKERKARAQILNEAQKLFVDDLWASHGKEVLNYLHDRGYKDREIKSMGLGAYVDRVRLIDYMEDKGYRQDQLEKAGLFTGGMGKTHQLAIVWRDRASRPSGLVCRATEDVEPKYLYTKGLKKSQGFVGYEKVRGEEAVIVVEGILDSLYLNAFDYPAVAVGGTSLSDKQLEALQDTETEEILIALDPDQAGKSGTEKIIKQLQGTNIRSYVLELPEGYDPDQLLREKRPEAFREVLEKAISGSKWLAQHITSRHNLETDRGRDKAVAEAMDTYKDLQKDQRSRYCEALVEALPISEEEISERVEKQRQKLTQENIVNTAKSVESKLIKFRQEGDTVNLQRTLEEGLNSLKQARGISAPEPYGQDNLLKDVTKEQTGLKTGYKNLDRYLDISRGALTFIAGRPGHGKTTFLLNLLLNMINRYPDQHFYFFSYEEARDRLSIKLIMNIASKTLHEETNFNAYINYLKEKRGENGKIEKALSMFDQYTKDGRLYLISEPMKSDKLTSTIHYLFNRDDTVGAVFIDYIQKVQPSTSQDQRYREIAKVTEQLRETAQSLGIAIIAGAQLNRNTTGRPKMSHLRESGDIEQDANLILGLVDGKKDSEASEIEEGSEYLHINIIKNREGPTKEQLIPHKWDRQNFKITSM